MKSKIKKSKNQKNKQLFAFPEYYILCFEDIHKNYSDLIFKRYVSEPIEKRRRITKSIEESESKDQYSKILQLLELIENEMRDTISRRPAFYWTHMYRRISPRLSPELGMRTDATTLVEVRSHAEQAILKFGSLSKTDGIASSAEVDFSEILGGRLETTFSKHFDEETINAYKEILKEKPQAVLTDFSEQDITDLYHIEGLAYQYWYITARLRSCGKGVTIKISENGDLIEERTEEQDRLIVSFDNRGERVLAREGFGTNVGTFVRSKGIKLSGAIFTTALNVEHYNASRLGLSGVAPGFVPNYLPFSFNAESFYEAHSYLNKYFKKKFGFGLLEFCQICSTLSKILISGENDSSKSSGLFYYSKFQRAYKLYKSSLDELKNSILNVIVKDRSEEKIKPSDAENEIDKVIDFLTLTEEKQSTIGIWSHGPKFVIIQSGTSYYYDYSSWFLIFKNLFFGLRNYDPDSQKGLQFEYEFGEFAKSKNFEVVAASKIIKKDGVEREIDVAIRLDDSLYIFECRSFERPIDFYIGKQKTINYRINDLKSKVDQVHTLVDFIKNNKSGDNYDFSWATNIFGSVVSPYTEWIWSLDKYLWSNLPDYPRIMSAPEAILYLQEIKFSNKHLRRP